MGWCSATGIFDEAIEAAYQLQDATKEATEPAEEREAIVAFAKKIRDVLERGDWDCQAESDFYDDLRWDLWPEWAEEEDKWAEDSD